MTTLRIALVACGKSKLKHPARAERLYTSTLFGLSLAYAQAVADRVFILSAKHGLLTPGKVIEPYDVTLDTMTEAERTDWQRRTSDAIRANVPADATIVLLAGELYATAVEGLPHTIERPLEGMTLFQRNRWLSETMKNNTLRLPAIEITQGARTFYASTVDGKTVPSIASVSRLRRDEGAQLAGYQRPEVMRHVQQIRDYVESAAPMIPNAVVIAFDERVRFEPAKSKASQKHARTGELVIPLAEEVPGLIVDGQQRLAAIRDASVESFPVALTCFITNDAAWQREQFILINSAKPLPRQLITEMLPQTGGQLPLALERRRFPAQLMDRLNRDPASPFRGRIKTSTNPEGVIADTAVLTMLENSLSDGALHDLDGQTGPDIAAMLAVVHAFWAATAQLWPEAWNEKPRRSRLVHGAGIVALGFVMDALATRSKARIPTQADFAEGLAPLADVCAWTAGRWPWGAEWHELENTGKGISRLSNHLMRALTAAKAA